MHQQTWRALVISIFGACVTWASSFVLWAPIVMWEAWHPGLANGIGETASASLSLLLSTPFRAIAYVLLYLEIHTEGEGESGHLTNGYRRPSSRQG